jgi:hypothetical protein
VVVAAKAKVARAAKIVVLAIVADPAVADPAVVVIAVAVDLVVPAAIDVAIAPPTWISTSSLPILYISITRRTS